MPTSDEFQVDYLCENSNLMSYTPNYLSMVSEDDVFTMMMSKLKKIFE